MINIAHTAIRAETIDRLRAAFADGRLFQVTVEGLQDAGRENLPDGLFVDLHTLSRRDSVRLAAIKARNPWLMIIALVSLETDLLRGIFELGHQDVVDDMLIAGFDDHPAQIRATVERARLRTVRATIEFACDPLPTVLVRPLLEEVLASIVEVKRAGQLATALGVSLPRLREEFHLSGLLPPNVLLGRFRALVASRMLQDSSKSIERIGVSLYASPTAFRNAFRDELGFTPGEVRQRGGLRFTGQIFRMQVQAWRLKLAS
jgi:AraC-like DNA-binding protein